MLQPYRPLTQKELEALPAGNYVVATRPTGGHMICWMATFATLHRLAELPMREPKGD